MKNKVYKAFKSKKGIRLLPVVIVGSSDGSKLEKMGWRPQYDFDTALEQTVKWYVENRWWREPLKR